MSGEPVERQLKLAGEALTLAQARHDLAREVADKLIISALRAGIPPGEVVHLIPLSTETIRILARIAGVPPAPRGGALRKVTRRGEIAS